MLFDVLQSHQGALFSSRSFLRRLTGRQHHPSRDAWGLDMLWTLLQENTVPECVLLAAPRLLWRSVRPASAG